MGEEPRRCWPSMTIGTSTPLSTIAIVPAKGERETTGYEIFDGVRPGFSLKLREAGQRTDGNREGGKRETIGRRRCYPRSLSCLEQPTLTSKVDVPVPNTQTVNLRIIHQQQVTSPSTGSDPRLWEGRCHQLSRQDKLMVIRPLIYLDSHWLFEGLSRSIRGSIWS